MDYRGLQAELRRLECSSWNTFGGKESFGSMSFFLRHLCINKTCKAAVATGWKGLRGQNAEAAHNAAVTSSQGYLFVAAQGVKIVQEICWPWRPWRKAIPGFGFGNAQPTPKVSHTNGKKQSAIHCVDEPDASFVCRVRNIFWPLESVIKRQTSWDGFIAHALSPCLPLPDQIVDKVTGLLRWQCGQSWVDALTKIHSSFPLQSFFCHLQKGTMQSELVLWLKDSTQNHPKRLPQASNFKVSHWIHWRKQINIVTQVQGLFVKFMWPTKKEFHAFHQNSEKIKNFWTEQQSKQRKHRCSPVRFCARVVSVSAVVQQDCDRHPTAFRKICLWCTQQVSPSLQNPSSMTPRESEVMNAHPTTPRLNNWLLPDSRDRQIRSNHWGKVSGSCRLELLSRWPWIQMLCGCGLKRTLFGTRSRETGIADLSHNQSNLHISGEHLTHLRSPRSLTCTANWNQRP